MKSIKISCLILLITCSMLICGCKSSSGENSNPVSAKIKPVITDLLPWKISKHSDDTIE